MRAKTGVGAEVPPKPAAPKTAAQTSGALAEDEALAYLQRSGLRLICRNFRCRSGELDLIMQDGRYLVFIEVRKRNNARFGSAAESITAAKRARLLRAAQFFLLRYTIPPPARFDVVAFDGEQCAWLKNAITL